MCTNNPVSASAVVCSKFSVVHCSLLLQLFVGLCLVVYY